MRKMNKPEICASCPYINDGYYDAERNIYVDLWECMRPEGPCVVTDEEIEEEDDDE